MINPIAWVKAHALLAAGGAGVVGLGVIHARSKAGSASSNGASYAGGTADTPPVMRQGLPSYDSTGIDQANALLDIDTRLSGLANQLDALDPAKRPPVTPKPIAKPTPKPKPKPRPKKPVVKKPGPKKPPPSVWRGKPVKPKRPVRRRAS